MSSREDYYKGLLFSKYEPNPVYAETSTGNWVYALDSTIQYEYGQHPNEWKRKLSNSFLKVQGTSSIPDLHIVLKCLSQGMSLTLSLKSCSERDFVPWNTVGLISDFYYSLTNLIDVIIIGQGSPRPLNHTKRINQFDAFKVIMPHPFNMFTSFNPALWNQRTLISQKQYTSHFPSKGISSDTASESKINKRHQIISDVDASDIMLGYLRGTTGFYMDDIYDKFLKETGLPNFKTQKARDGVNPKLQNSNVNFLDCLYRYRTKAHYRDFLYLTNNCYDPTLGYNDHINQNFIISLFNISHFMTEVAFRYLEARLGTQEKGHILKVLVGSHKSNKYGLWDHH